MKSAYKNYFREILKKYRQQTASSEETKFLESYYNMFEVKQGLIDDENESEFAELKNDIKANIDERIAGPKIRKLSSDWIKYGAAAAAVLLVSLSIYLVSYQQKNSLVAQMDRSISPGGNKAVLTLANGSKIVLNEVKTGVIAHQSGIRISKKNNGELIYQVSASPNLTEETTINTISTPNGGQYTIVLSDGSRVKLNAASSLSFPTSFKGTERVVDLQGEAYFEVAKNAQHTFKVTSGLQTVEVLGTHFNVEAYADERTIKTTLVEGSVKVVVGKNHSIISPGQQALVSRENVGSITKAEVNLDKETAWTNDLFIFDGDNLKSVMSEISRWYNITTVYTGTIPDKKFFGGISRNSKLSEVFKILELNQVKLSLKGKTVYVSYDPSGNE
ncbi:FecR family protein [Pedobacter foliorum]|uniref:FecR family protein n=1 Tax=Pedobacter foliorum TaxID=2739058 RepID=UPI001566D16C|nr:FecR family protein [Pedobacter foliorum]NRF37449.1 FecR family protein [Pedobacter foliorum]